MRPSDPPAGALSLVASERNIAYLHHHLAARYPGLGRHDVDDIIDTVMERVVARIMDGRWVPEPHEPMIRAYLRNAVNWAALDLLRSAQRQRERSVPTEALHELVLSDDEAAAALDRNATVENVRSALQRIRGAGDATLFLVVTSILDHIQRTGTQPSNRQTGAACGLSHTAVANALVRLRPYFADARQG